MEAVEVLLAPGGNLGHELLRCLAGLLGRDHDRRAVGVVGADEMDFDRGPIVAHLHSLMSHPDVSLDVLHHVPDVKGRVGVGQGGGDEQLAGHAVDSREAPSRTDGPLAR